MAEKLPESPDDRTKVLMQRIHEVSVRLKVIAEAEEIIFNESVKHSFFEGNEEA